MYQTKREDRNYQYSLLYFNARSFYFPNLERTPLLTLGHYIGIARWMSSRIAPPFDDRFWHFLSSKILARGLNQGMALPASPLIFVAFRGLHGCALGQQLCRRLLLIHAPERAPMYRRARRADWCFGTVAIHVRS